MCLVTGETDSRTSCFVPQTQCVVKLSDQSWLESISQRLVLCFPECLPGSMFSGLLPKATDCCSSLRSPSGCLLLLAVNSMNASFSHAA